MNILIVSQYFAPDVTAAAYRITETAGLLKKSGAAIHVVTSTPHKGGVDSRRLGDFDDTEITRVQISALAGERLVDYFSQYFGFAWKALRASARLHRKRSFDVVWVTSPPLFVVLCSIVLRALFRVPVVLDVRDIWPESAVAIGKLRPGSLMDRAGRILERAAYRFCDGLTCVAPPMQSYLEARTNKPVSVVYNGILEATVPDELEPPTEPLTICYAGNLGYAQRLDIVLRAFSEAVRASACVQARLRLIGTGAMEEELHSLVQQLNIAELVDFAGARPKAEASRMMGECGLLLVPLGDSPIFDLGIPSKVFDCMALGRPIIATVRREAAAVLEATGGNIVIEPGDEAGLAQAIARGWREQARLAERARANRFLVLEKYTREAATDALIAVLSEVTQKSTKDRQYGY